MGVTKRKNILRDEKGIALIETIPLIIIFIVLVSAGLGMFGVIHTAVLNSIGARTYAYETFRQRANLYYFRENDSGLTRPMSFKRKEWRFHAVQNESDSRNTLVATTRPISFGRAVDAVDTTVDIHNQQVYDLPSRNERVSVSPAWIMVGYGICLNANCGNGN